MAYTHTFSDSMESNISSTASNLDCQFHEPTNAVQHYMHETQFKIYENFSIGLGLHTINLKSSDQ